MRSPSKSGFYSVLKRLTGAQQAFFEENADRLEMPAGSCLCKQGEPAESVFLIEDGSAEVLLESDDHTRHQHLGYLTRGDFFGELALLNGDDRSATVRAKTDVIVRRIKSENFLLLLEQLPAFGSHIAQTLAHRFKTFTAEVKYQSHCLHLRGTLPLFDLLTVFQTIRDSQAHGELVLSNMESEPVAIYQFRGTTLTRAQYGHLSGQEAVWHALCDTEIQGTFAFRIIDPSEFESIAGPLSLELTPLLFQGVVKRDQLRQLSPVVRSLRGTIRRSRENLRWIDEERRALAERIWNTLEPHPIELAAAWRNSQVCLCHFAQVIRDLDASGQVKLEQKKASD